VSHRPALASERQVEISHEHVAWIMLVARVAIACAAAATDGALAAIITIAITVSRVVPVPHRVSRQGGSLRTMRLGHCEYE
jgi:hypothetical protein